MPPIPRCLLTTTDPSALNQADLPRPSVSSVSSESETASESPSTSRRDEKLSGTVPNLFWRAVAMDDLRAARNFVGLPEESQVTLAGAKSFAYVRQGTEVWDALHDGRLTTGVLKAALGFVEDGVDKRALGLGKRHGGHNAILSACRRLQREKWCDDDEVGDVADDARRRNEAATAAFNRQIDGDDDDETEDECDDVGLCDDSAGELLSGVGSNASAMDILAASLASAAKKKTSKKGKKKKKRGSGKKNRVAGDSSMLTNAQYSRALARGGEHAIRLAWGSAQEASTLCSMMVHFKGSTVYEAGLCMLDAASDVPKAWGVGPLPPVGASPDGLIIMASGERFVVEVKNSSPFRQMPGRYVVADREPYAKPPAYHMPQVQLEMLCTGTRSALLAMQSMTYGIKIFRVERDDDFIASMLRRISRLYTMYARKGKDPPMNWEVRSIEHKKMVGAAVRLAGAATVYDHIPTSLVPNDGSIHVEENAFVA